MLTMEVFYTLLSRKSQDNAPYLKALSAVARASRSQLDTLKSDLAWQDWPATETSR